MKDILYFVTAFEKGKGDWLEEVFLNDEEQATACCKYLNKTKGKANERGEQIIYFTVGSYNKGFCEEEYISKVVELERVEEEKLQEKELAELARLKEKYEKQ